MLEISISEYQLKSRFRPNARAQNQLRQGFLLRGKSADGIVAYADCHPWPEFGDAPIEKQIDDLSLKKFSSLILKRSRAFLLRDLAQRQRKISAPSPSAILKNHFLVVDTMSFDQQQAEVCWQQGFSTLKIKLSPTLQGQQFANIFRGTKQRLRLDFNASASFEQVEKFILDLPTEMLEQIEFIEDPCPYQERDWAKLNLLVPLALDFAGGSHLDFAVIAEKPTFNFVILKPARQEPAAILDFAEMAHVKVVITSSMDHPLGVMQTWSLAHELKHEHQKLVSPVCGCFSFSVYEQDEFSRLIGVEGSALLPPRADRSDFDQLLEARHWRSLGDYEL